MAENKRTYTEVKLERANRIAVQNTYTGFKADFYRTHKHLVTLLSEDTTWEADTTANKSAQREDFRKWAIEHADVVGIIWNPNDMRSDNNKRIAKYEDDFSLTDDTIKLMFDDMWDLTNSCCPDLKWKGITVDCITPMTHSAKGYDLSKMGVIDGKYEKNGNWAWAEIEMTLTLTKDEQEIYYTTKVQLVSGQLKKPHITKTTFSESIKESLKEAGLWVEEVKEEKSTKTKSEEVIEPVTDTNKEIQEESKPKKTRKSTKKSKTETVQA